MNGSAPLWLQGSRDHLVRPPRPLPDVELARADTPFGALRAVWTHTPRAVTVTRDAAPAAVLTGPGLLTVPVVGRAGADGPDVLLGGVAGTSRWVAGRWSRSELGRARTVQVEVGGRTWTSRQDDGVRVLERDAARVEHGPDGLLSWSDGAGADDVVLAVALLGGLHPSGFATLATKLLSSGAPGA